MHRGNVTVIITLLYTFFFPLFGHTRCLGLMIIFPRSWKTYLSIFDSHCLMSRGDIQETLVTGIKMRRQMSQYYCNIDLFWSNFESGRLFCEQLHEHFLPAFHLMKKLNKSVQFLVIHEARN